MFRLNIGLFLLSGRIGSNLTLITAGQIVKLIGDIKSGQLIKFVINLQKIKCQITEEENPNMTVETWKHTMQSNQSSSKPMINPKALLSSI